MAETFQRYNKAHLFHGILFFTKSILKSLVILGTRLAFSGAIYSQIALSFAPNRIFFSANENGTVKQNSQSDFKPLFKPITLQKNEKQKSHCLANLAIKLCDFKMDLIKWQLNFLSCNFGLKSYL